MQFLYVDDTIIFCEAIQMQLMHLNRTPMWFNVISGLKAKMDKSELILVKRVDNFDMLACKLECWVGRLPSTYLGLYLDNSFTRSPCSSNNIASLLAKPSIGFLL